MAGEEFVGEVLRSDFFDVDSVSQDLIRERLKTLLDHYGYSDILVPVFTCTMELAVNAVKANLKNLYFENYAARSKSGRVNALSYRKSLELFRHELRDNGARHLVAMAAERNIRSTIEIGMKPGRILSVRVTNPNSMTRIEAANVRRRLEAVKHISAMSDYLSRNEEEMLYEGAGLGIVFVGLVIRRLNLPENTFEIASGKTDTVARMEIPLVPSVLDSYREIVNGRGDKK
jgi:hypothetical protein